LGVPRVQFYLIGMHKLPGPRNAIRPSRGARFLRMLSIAVSIGSPDFHQRKAEKIHLKPFWFHGRRRSPIVFGLKTIPIGIFKCEMMLTAPLSVIGRQRTVHACSLIGNGSRLPPLSEFCASWRCGRRSGWPACASLAFCIATISADLFFGLSIAAVTAAPRKSAEITTITGNLATPPMHPAAPHGTPPSADRAFKSECLQK
jgi:hypothetical protein